MISNIDINSYTFIAPILFFLSQLLRGVRLYFALGRWRVPLYSILIVHLIGVITGYFLVALSYEICVLLYFICYHREAIIPVFYSLVILRMLDVLSLLTFTVISGIDTSQFLIAMIFLFFMLWILIFTLNTMIYRIRNKILAYPYPFILDKEILLFLSKMQESIKLSAWSRSGTISAILIMTAGLWLLEWSALYLYFSSSSLAAQAIVERVASSIGIAMTNSNNGYSLLMYGVYVGLPLLLILNIYKLKKGQ